MDTLIGVDQYGRHHGPLDPKAPKRSLLEKLGARSGRPMYVDGKDGQAEKVGYVVSMGRGYAQLWVCFYTIAPSTLWRRGV